MAARQAAVIGRLSKQLPAGAQRFALTTRQQLVAAGSGSEEWQPVGVPGGAPVLDFAVSGQELWVLLPGGRVGHSPDLGRNWDPPVETGARDATAILFANSRRGEIRTRSGALFRTTDGGQSWRPVERKE